MFVGFVITVSNYIFALCIGGSGGGNDGFALLSAGTVYWAKSLELWFGVLVLMTGKQCSRVHNKKDP